MQTHQPLIRWLAGTLPNAEVTHKATIHRDSFGIYRAATACYRQGVQRDLHGLPPTEQSHGALVFTPVVAPEAQGLSAEGEHLL